MTNFRWIASFVVAATMTSALLAESHCPGNVASLPFRLVNRHQIVLAVYINHSGPYDFLLDTGTHTTIVGPSLATELHLSTRGAVVVTGAGFHASASFARLDLIEVGPRAVASQEVLVFGLMNLRSVDSHIRGILGEDFLKRFDMLIDNAHKLLCLDDSAAMRAEVKGPHIAFVVADQTSGDEQGSGVLIISARLSDVAQPVHLKLDSGTNASFLYNTSGHMVPRSFGSESVVGGGADGDQKLFSSLPPQDVKIGTLKLPGVTFMTLAHPVKDPRRMEFDGLLSIDLFRRVFVDYADRFVVLEPR